MDIDTEEGLNLSLSLQPTPPPRFQGVFACCYCPRKFRSSQALGGHQNAHKLQGNLARQEREATAALAAAHGEQAAAGNKTGPDNVVDDSAPRQVHPDAWAGERKVYRRRLQGAAGAAVAGGNGELADEMIDLCLKL